MKAPETFAALLRGINVGGRNRLSMPELAELFRALGHEDVVTYIQSGNVVFRAEGRPREIVRGIETGIVGEIVGVAHEGIHGAQGIAFF